MLEAIRGRMLAAMGIVQCVSTFAVVAGSTATCSKPAEDTESATSDRSLKTDDRKPKPSATESASVARPPTSREVPLPPEPALTDDDGCAARVVCNTPKAIIRRHYPAPFENCLVAPGFSEKATTAHRLKAVKDPAADSAQMVACCYVQECRRPTKGRFHHDGADILIASIRSEMRSEMQTIEEAKRWLVDAETEHASVASFACLARNLLALGAPWELIRRLEQAASDEIVHTALSLEVARALGAQTILVGPLVLPKTVKTTIDLFRETLLDGCIGETRAALDAYAHAREPSLFDTTYKQIAIDELSHAELSFEVLAWLVRREPELASPLNLSFLNDLPDDDGVIAEVVWPCIEALQRSH